MPEILNTIPRERLLYELTKDKLIKPTLKGGNEIYSFTMRDAPYLMYEVARLREVSYRAAGCGSGKIIDIDDFDIHMPQYHQLIVWNPREQEIIGGYRFAVCSEYINNIDRLSMAHYFRFSKKFIKDYLPYSMELGRAWVNPEYQPNSGNRKSIFALDNLWDGIGAIISMYHKIQYLYGKLTIPEKYNHVARLLLQWLLHHYFGDKKRLITPETPVPTPEVITVAGTKATGFDFTSDFKIVAQYIRGLGYTIPPLVSAYTGLANIITTFGTTLNPELNNSFETGLMIKISDVHPDKLERYVFRNKNKESIAA